MRTKSRMSSPAELGQETLQTAAHRRHQVPAEGC